MITSKPRPKRYHINFHDMQTQRKEGQPEWEMYYIRPEIGTKVAFFQAYYSDVVKMAAKKKMKIDSNWPCYKLTAADIDRELNLPDSINP